MLLKNVEFFIVVRLPDEKTPLVQFVKRQLETLNPVAAVDEKMAVVSLSSFPWSVFPRQSIETSLAVTFIQVAPIPTSA